MKTLTTTFAALFALAALTLSTTDANAGGFSINVGGHHGTSVRIGGHHGVQVRVGGHRGHGGHGGYGGHGGHVIVRQPVIVYHQYYVNFHMDGQRTLHFHNDHQAHRTANYLRRLGAHVDIVHTATDIDVIYHMEGSRSYNFTSDHAAHNFECAVERYGFHARVIHH